MFQINAPFRGRLFEGAFNRGGVYFENFEKGGRLFEGGV